MFTNSKLKLQSFNCFPFFVNHYQCITFVGQEVGQISPKHFSIALVENQLAQVKKKRTTITKKLGLPKKKVVQNGNKDVPLDSPSMQTRSKLALRSSHAMSTRNKRRLSL
jgi:hypothetical protein